MLAGFSSICPYVYCIHKGSGQKKYDSRNRLRMSHAELVGTYII